MYPDDVLGYHSDKLRRMREGNNCANGVSALCIREKDHIVCVTRKSNMWEHMVFLTPWSSYIYDCFLHQVLLLMIAFHRVFHELYKLTHFFVCCYVLVIGSSSFHLIQTIFWTYYSFARAIF